MSSKYNIKCETWSDERKEIFVTSDSKVWPCCNYTSAELNPDNKDKLDDDEYVAKICKEDPDWNNCDVNPISKILEHDFFTKHISKENWASDNPPTMCVACCHYKEKQ